MLLSGTTYIGIDPTAGRTPFTYAVLDADCNLLLLGCGEMDEALAFITSQMDVFVAVNGPRNPNFGLVKRKLENQGLLPGQMRGADLRMAEYLLREKGIVISPTPSRRELCPEWMQLSFSLYKKLDEIGFKPYPSEKAPRQLLETHPHAAFCVMVEQQPLSKPTLEGRLQRQLILHEANVGIRNPMKFFEEITRHRLIKGIFPMEVIYSPEQLDALAAAYIAYLAANDPDKIIFIGSSEEGRIVLPTHELNDKY
ncbi:MAG: hypothetical protein A2X25_02000 [Chloroflexi bacterium GWB2_49_20]|nr:MAG: hypothetical protein A2X25_02000 [Chloroflexi bacterium GWB2_49_20]OGN78219.1 MAG: hypothetical protein A2X26_14605 [Chloroflexi bacterium GWC2_49_37]OGN85255.1 MAG: hypothetical protein A2X27_07260 [Chloroflexi bacterium GWD2_49_16]